LKIDPNLTDAAMNLVILRVEGGDLAGALEDASRILHHRPDSARAHFTMGYVLRYAGAMEESARECDAALAIDPKDSWWRSCASTFSHLGNYERAEDYIRLDAGTQWAALVESWVRLRQGRPAEALALLAGAPDNESARMARACLEGRQLPEDDPILRNLKSQTSAVRDSEPKYYEAGWLCYCGYTGMALRLLRQAVEGNYLVYPAMDRDPLFAKVRNTAEFASIRALAIEKQKQLTAPRTK